MYPKTQTTPSTSPTTQTTASASPTAGSPDFPTLESEVLAHWRSTEVFRRSVQSRPATTSGRPNEFVVYDGPPFANGLPHYGHLLTGYAKDAVPRFQTMRGKRVERRFGWDTHGLPAENEAMRLLGLNGVGEARALGVAAFNKTCRDSVLGYTGVWEEYVERQGRWVDFTDDYKTMDADYMESVMWAFKTLHEKGLVYEGWKVVPYCPVDQTPLSNSETRAEDDTYRDRTDTSVTVALRLETGEFVLVWTTTPWTLPANLGVAVHPEMTYARFEHATTGQVYLLASSRAEAYASVLGEEWAQTGTVTGATLVGLSYEPPFTCFSANQPVGRSGGQPGSQAAGQSGAHRVVAAEWVTSTDGTGFVHLAPDFGEDDKATLEPHGVHPVNPVDAAGRYTGLVERYRGLLVFEANDRVVEDLRSVHSGLQVPGMSEQVRLVEVAPYTHSYPHCYRCGSPLMYRCLDSWFLATTTLRERMLEANRQVRWVPEHTGSGQFHTWLDNTRDWALSRSRFWGSPVPVWKSTDPAYPRTDVYGSLAQLQADFGTLPLNEAGEVDLHRPFVDDLTRPNPDDPRTPDQGQSMMVRVPDVLDCWFESGAMPFAQVHYPFENAGPEGWFETHFPGDFVVEYVAQTRGWFYAMHVLATALFDSPAFTTVVSHGVVLGDDGRKMSKSLHNYPDVRGVFDTHGSDALRWFLLSSPVLSGGTLSVTEDGVRGAVKDVLLPYWNAYKFFTLYANTFAGVDETGAVCPYEAHWSTESTNLFDRWLLAETARLVSDLTQAMEDYDFPAACGLVARWLDGLTNWYVRGNRDRFWNRTGTSPQAQDDCRAGFDTLYTALETFSRAVAPLLPFTAEVVWRGLTGGESVHLCDYPVPGGGGGDEEEDRSVSVRVGDLPEDATLVALMARAREVCSAAAGVRKKAGVKTRQPLASVTFTGPDALSLQPLSGVLARECNVLTVHLFEADADLTADGAEKQPAKPVLVPDFRAAGPRLKAAMKQVAEAAKNGDYVLVEDGTAVVGGVVLVSGEFTLVAPVAEEPLGDDTSGDTVADTAVLSSGGRVRLEMTLTPELVDEGRYRDVLRLVQEARKTSGYAVTDTPALQLTVEDGLVAMLSQRMDRLRADTNVSTVQVLRPEEATVGALTEEASVRVSLT